MKIYMVECVRTLSAKLKTLIEEKELGEVEAQISTWEEAFFDLQGKHADVIFFDIRTANRENIKNITALKKIVPKASLLAFSSLFDTESVEGLYAAGVEYILHKPVNDIEVENTLRNLEMARTLKRLLRMIPQESESIIVSEEEKPSAQSEDEGLDITIKRLKAILREIGILNEAGSKDIINIVRYLLEKGMDFRDIPMRDLCKKMGDNPKSVEQRIRRAATAGLSSLALRGMDDYADPIYNEYGDRLYGFEQMKSEMNFICGKGDKHGNVKIKKFLGGLLDCCLEG
ncbi:MAG: DNA-binding domain-containing protein [Johnsonella sp.]|nr:DNA-binding domain-containing protein [Johnsonella sp.]